MNDRVSEFLQKCDRIFSKYWKFFFYSRGLEFQRYSIGKFEALLKTATSLKEEMINTPDEEAANTMLSVEYLLKALINELEMFVSLKEDRMHDAWKSLVQAQYNLRWSLQAGSISLDNGRQNYLNKLLLWEKTLFPPQTYQSIGAVAESSTCSICNQEYGRCNHVVGRPYLGRLCHRKITKLREVKEVSIVTGEPGNKLCRVEAFDDRGHWRDMMTWRICRSHSPSL